MATSAHLSLKVLGEDVQSKALVATSRSTSYPMHLANSQGLHKSPRSNKLKVKSEDGHATPFTLEFLVLRLSCDNSNKTESGILLEEYQGIMKKRESSREKYHRRSQSVATADFYSGKLHGPSKEVVFCKPTRHHTCKISTAPLKKRQEIIHAVEMRLPVAKNNSITLINFPSP